ncbi:MAG TPA: DUF2752 domain-containing protein [Verrucomicrobiae bacterium]
MDSVPPKISTVNTRVTVLLVLAAAGVATMVYFFNPAKFGFYPVCQFHRITGLNCPGCGGTRSLYALLHGQFALAVRDNALAVAGLIFLTARASWFGWNRIRGRANGNFFPTRYLWPLLVLAVVFTVLRNLPAFSFLSP